MKFKNSVLLLVLIGIVYVGVVAQQQNGTAALVVSDADIQVGAVRMDEYLPLLKGKEVGVLANHTSLVGTTHLVDTLLSRGVHIEKIFTPEHGFRGDADAGAHVNSSVDTKTALPIVSLYGENKKPFPEQLAGLDIVVFDLQDVGVRFYTYISTLSYLMEACAENGVDVLVLDRPNPNGFYVDGPVLQEKYSSFVGLHKVPVVYGMTIGEYAQMVNGEKWLKDGACCRLWIIPIKGYHHSMRYSLPVSPSPNLKTMEAIYLYPSLCFFEGTPVSVGRGTDTPFLLYGHPDFNRYDTVFVPESRNGARKPKLQGEVCKGYDLSSVADDIRLQGGLRLTYLQDAYEQLGKDSSFFTRFFYLLAGTDVLVRDLVQAKTLKEIREQWETEISSFKNIRKKYLLYPDFE